MIGLIHDLLARQDPDKPHTLLTRVVVGFCICFGFVVLYGFYGLIGSVVVYLLGVELLGLPLGWMYLPLVIGMLLGVRKSFAEIRKYLVNFGHGR